MQNIIKYYYYLSDNKLELDLNEIKKIMEKVAYWKNSRKIKFYP